MVVNRRISSLALRVLLRRVLALILPLSLASTLYLYLYPVFHGCAFPIPNNLNSSSTSSGFSWKNAISASAPGAFVNTVLQHVLPRYAQHSKTVPEPAIFRLLVLADPQLEGDSSLPNPDDEFLPRLRSHWGVVRSAAAVLGNSTSGPLALPSLADCDQFLSAVRSVLETFVREDIPSAVQATRKRLDLFGNDYYLAHIYRTLHWWSRPTHVAVLGDLIGSQWVTDGEFEQRGWRYWNRVFRGGERVWDEVAIAGETGDQETLKRYDSPWARKIINVVGNHDIGYSGDVSTGRLERFERVFGPANWDLRFRHALEDTNGHSTVSPTLQIINLNGLTLDGPALEPQIQSDSYAYINDVIAQRSYPVEDRTTFTLLLTHVPLHKREGICADAPHFELHDADDEEGEESVPRFRDGGLKEQNHLSEQISSAGIFQGIFGLSGDENVAGHGWGRNGLILTGHDHTGCDVVHFVNQSAVPSEPESGPWHWDAIRYASGSSSSSRHTPSMREVTLRSMMGEYGGNAGLLSVWFDPDPAVNEWRYTITTCAAGVQHIWWAVHGISLATGLMLTLWVILAIIHQGTRLFHHLRNRRKPVKPEKRRKSLDGIQLETISALSMHLMMKGREERREKEGPNPNGR
ncbi:hypothetical protein Egran_04554 [Elaphomyces granulatus]|uniref:Calcineurin-like phosphoesterase domain-containing protein n=1 Tax=Elaphomyces granulatus TaxID=519963 RepID=A0A232LU42_9EURO|nr:hypothetical protein Egran_04554 [Elaphomyces granulatus]